MSSKTKLLQASIRKAIDSRTLTMESLEVINTFDSFAGDGVDEDMLSMESIYGEILETTVSLESMSELYDDFANLAIGMEGRQYLPLDRGVQFRKYLGRIPADVAATMPPTKLMSVSTVSLEALSGSVLSVLMDALKVILDTLWQAVLKFVDFLKSLGPKVGERYAKINAAIDAIIKTGAIRKKFEIEWQASDHSIQRMGQYPANASVLRNNLSMSIYALEAYAELIVKALSETMTTYHSEVNSLLISQDVKSLIPVGVKIRNVYNDSGIKQVESMADGTNSLKNRFVGNLEFKVISGYKQDLNNMFFGHRFEFIADPATSVKPTDAPAAATYSPSELKSVATTAMTSLHGLPQNTDEKYEQLHNLAKQCQAVAERFSKEPVFNDRGDIPGEIISIDAEGRYLLNVNKEFARLIRMPLMEFHKVGVQMAVDTSNYLARHIAAYK